MIKQIQILGGKAMVVELTEVTTAVSLHGPDNMGDMALIYNGQAYYCIPKGNWQIVGMLSEVTDKQAAGMVEYDEDIRYYRAYGVHPVESRSGKKSQLVGYLDALESLESAIRAEGYSFENKSTNPDNVCYFSLDRMKEDVIAYEGAQSRVLCRERTLILKKV